MRAYLVILIFFGVLLQGFSKVLIVAEYALNKDYIAKNICENRDKPKMNCKGKCHLKKQLAEDEQGKKGTSQTQHEKQDVNLFFQYANDLKLPLLVVPVVDLKFPPADSFLLLNFIKNIFHPPSHSLSF